MFFKRSSCRTNIVCILLIPMPYICIPPLLFLVDEHIFGVACFFGASNFSVITSCINDMPHLT